MSFSFNFVVSEPENDSEKEARAVQKENNELVKPIAQFEEVYPRLDQEHIFEDYENSVLDMTSLKVQFLDGGQLQEKLQGRLGEAVRDSLDIIPNVYEGGMKVWEGSIDLAEYIESNITVTSDTKVLELGCGAGLPGLTAALRGASVHFQDYNKEVLQLLTVPNAFANLGKAVYTQCRFFAGDWTTLTSKLAEQSYDIILTSETIYQPTSYRELLKIFARCLKDSGKVLLAAKTCYFGVGGGTREFQDVVAEDGTFESKVVFVTDTGVQREILEIRRRR